MRLLLFLSLASSVAPKSALHFLPEGHLSQAQVDLFDHAVAQFVRVRRCRTTFSRHGGQHRAADRPLGGMLVKPPEERRIPIVDDMRGHLDASAVLPFPYDSRLRASSLPEDLQCAVRLSVVHESSITMWRYGFTDLLQRWSLSLRSVTRRINELMPSTVAVVSRGVNTAVMAALIDAMGWLDQDLVQRFVQGFPVQGVIPDSGVFRPLQRSPADVAAFQSSFHAFRASAHAWNRRHLARMWSGIHADAERIEVLTAVARKTASERSKGVAIGPFGSVDAVKHSMLARLPHASWSDLLVKAMDRFGVTQKGTIRAIDNGRSNGANDAAFLYETITTPSWFFVAIVARAAAVVAVHHGMYVPSITTALCDLSMAYRLIGTSQPWATVFGIFDTLVTPPRPQYYYLPGHNFGLAASVVNFNRYPEFVVTVARVYYALPVEHYFDDFVIVDVSDAGNSGLRAIETIIACLGDPPSPPSPRASPPPPPRAPVLDPSKTQPTGYLNKVLGMMADTSAVHSAHEVYFRSDAERSNGILADWWAAFRAGVLPPGLAASINGKLQYVCTGAFQGVGRAATLPLLQRQHRDTSSLFLPDSELHHSLLFFDALLPRLPPLRVPILASTTPPLSIYTDAAFWVRRDEKVRRGKVGSCLKSPDASSLRGGLGAVVYDPITRITRYAYARPDWPTLLRLFTLHRKTYITQLEMLAGLAVYSTFPELVAGRRVLHWIDNTAALSSLVHGYSGKRDLAKMTNIFHLQLAGLRTHVYLDYVPSKADIADLPSRMAFGELSAQLAGLHVLPGVELIIPGMGEWSASLGSWVQRFMHINTSRPV